MTSQSIMTQVEMFQRQWAKPRKRGNLIVTDIKFLNRGKIFKLTQWSQRVEGKHQNFNVLESVNETKFFDLQIGKVGKLKDGWIFNVELFDIELVFPLKQQILIELIVERTSTETILEVVDKHHFDRS